MYKTLIFQLESEFCIPEKVSTSCYRNSPTADFSNNNNNNYWKKLRQFRKDCDLANNHLAPDNNSNNLSSNNLKIELFLATSKFKIPKFRPELKV